MKTIAADSGGSAGRRGRLDHGQDHRPPSVGIESMDEIALTYQAW